jgi:IS605 OrfB family transposase
LITIKLPYKSTLEFQDKLFSLRKQYSSVVRYSYNRLKDGLSEKEIRDSFCKLNNINELDVWTKQCGIIESKSILNKNGDDKVIFGGKHNFLNRIKNKISGDFLKDKRLLPLTIFGEKAQKGNRKFKLNILNNNQIIYKLNKKEHFILELPNLRNNLKNKLSNLQLFNENEGLTYQVKLTDKFIYFSFEEVTETKILDEDIYMGIDLNPEFIGLSIKKGDDILKTECFNLSKIIGKFKTLNKSSNSLEMKYLNNKLNHEIIEISKKISEISLKNKCKFIFIEDLKFKKEKSYKSFNRLTKNLWKRNIFIDNLDKRCILNGQKMYKINPAYTSFIGNCMYGYVDPINASLEIGRRGYEIIIKKTKKFYPELWIKDSLKDQWKEHFSEFPDSWKELFGLVKNSKLRYRVSTDTVVFSKFKTERSYISYLCNLSC